MVLTRLHAWVVQDIDLVHTFQPAQQSSATAMMDVSSDSTGLLVLSPSTRTCTNGPNRLAHVPLLE